MVGLDLDGFRRTIRGHRKDMELRLNQAEFCKLHATRWLADK